MKRKYHTRSPRRYPRVAPSEAVYLISASDAAKALGVSKASLSRWRVQWKQNGTSAGPEPVWITPRIVKYRADECYNFGSTFLERMHATTASIGTTTSAATAAGAR